jgi:endonuclease YncB( thermonuclease family)
MRRLAPALLALCAGACAAARGETSPSAEPAPGARPTSARGRGEACSLVRVVDGDTVVVLLRGREEHVRLLAVDTEESIHSSSKPVTEFGRATSAWAKAWVPAGAGCWLEWGPERRDVYDRLLAYFWYDAGGGWRHYNLELIERGWSPYFTKYGYSREHHDDFVAAEGQARTARVGLWAPENAGSLRGTYLGPDGLEAQWNGRAEALRRFDEARAAGRRDVVAVRGGLAELRKRLGQRVTVFAAVRTTTVDGGWWVGRCEGSPRDPFEIALPLTQASPLGPMIERYRYFTGVLTKADRGLRLEVASPNDVREEAP